MHKIRTSMELFCFINDSVLYNEAASLLYFGNEFVKLTFKENQLMRAILTSDSGIVTKEELLSSVWQYNESAETNLVETQIARFRAKLPYDILINKSGSVSLDRCTSLDSH